MGRALVSALGLLALIAAVPVVYVLGLGKLWDKAEHETHLIPSGYVGPVVILFDEPGGAPPEREAGARVFRIPASGVVHSQLSPNDGWGLPDYFYVDAAGHRTKLFSGAPCERDLAANVVEACMLGHTTFSNLPDRRYQAYVVGRPADQKRWGWPAERFVDSVVYGRPNALATPSNETLQQSAH